MAAKTSFGTSNNTLSIMKGVRAFSVAQYCEMGVDMVAASDMCTRK